MARPPRTDEQRPGRTNKSAVPPAQPEDHRGDATNVTSTTDQRRLAFGMLLLSAAFLLLLARPLFAGQVYVFEDLGGLFLPAFHQYAEALVKGNSIAWTPQYWNGFDLHADGLTGMYHPAHYLLFRFFPLAIAFNLLIVLHYAVMLPGMYLLLRRFHLTPYPALLGAFLFAFSGWNVLHHVHPNVLASVCHMPWLLLAVHTVATARERRTQHLGFLGVALLTGSQTLTAFPQMQWITTLGEAILALYLLFWRFGTEEGAPDDRWRRVALLVVASLLGYALGAVQLLPTLHLVATSPRMNQSAEYRLQFSQNPADYAQWFSPYYHYNRGFTGNIHTSGVYNSAFCTAALAWMAIRWRAREPHLRVARAALIFGAIMCFLALGKYNGLYVLAAKIPPFGTFRGQYRHMVLAQAALATLGGVMAMDLWLLRQRAETIPWRRLWPLAIAPVLSVLLAVVMLVGWHGQLHDLWLKPLFVTHPVVGLVFVFVTSLLVALAARGAKWPHYLFPLLVFLDLSLWGMSYVWSTPPQSIAQLISKQAVAPPEPARGRIHYTNTFINSWEDPQIWTTSVGALKGERYTKGYVQLAPGRKLDTESRAAQRLAGVEWVRSPSGWERLPDPLPRVRLVSRVQVSDDPASVIERIDLATMALVDRTVPVDEGSLPGTATLTRDAPGLITIETKAPGAQFLVVSESYDTGWWVSVDDSKPTPAVRAYGDFLGCALPAGSHRVTLRYEPAELVKGRTISLIALLLSFAAFAALEFGRRRSLPAGTAEPLTNGR